MAEVNFESGGGKPKAAKPRQKKMSLKIDMTPMVDLAFLLLTFFMLTTAFSKPEAMKISVPPNQKKHPVNVADIVNLILAPGDRLYYYNGTDPAHAKEVSFSPANKNYVGRFLVKAKEDNFKNRAGGDSSRFRFTVLIKPADGSRYKNLVDILDEMHISGIKNYCLMDVSPDELSMIKEREQK
jgi:biopolymer transport protein ExbD